MSSISDFENKFIIVTGDGNSFGDNDSNDFFWKNSSIKQIEFNISQFDYPGVAGSQINRGTNQARVFNLEIFFQGDDNVARASVFEKSSLDPRPWDINHPVYGSITVQPINLEFDYTGYNTTRVTGKIIETLARTKLIFTTIPRNKIIVDQANVVEAVTNNYSNTVPKTNDVKTLSNYNNALYKIGSLKVKITEDAGTYTNLYAQSTAGILGLTGDVLSGITQFQALINFPALMVLSVQDRFTIIESQFSSLSSNLSTILTPRDKTNFEVTSTSLISSICIAAVTCYDNNNMVITDGQLSDYNNRQDVVNIIMRIQALYNQLLSILDGLQTPNNGLETSYIPDFDVMSGLDDLINYTIENLFLIALSSKQERTLYLEKDTNLIVLVHRIYGLQPDDSTIDTFILNNNIGINELIQIRMGRKISYYI